MLLCGVCGSAGRSWLSSSSHKRRPLELLHVRTPEWLWTTATTGRLANQITTLLRQQPWAGVCESFWRKYEENILFYSFCSHHFLFYFRSQPNCILQLQQRRENQSESSPYLMALPQVVLYNARFRLIRLKCSLAMANILINCGFFFVLFRSAGAERFRHPGGQVYCIWSVWGLHHCRHCSTPGTYHVRGRRSQCHPQACKSVITSVSWKNYSFRCGKGNLQVQFVSFPLLILNFLF